MATLQEQRERKETIEGELASFQKAIAERRSAGKTGTELWGEGEQKKFESLREEHNKLSVSIDSEARAADLEKYIETAAEQRSKQTTNGRPNPKLTDTIPGNAAEADFGEFFSSRDAARAHQKEERSRALAFSAWAAGNQCNSAEARSEASKFGVDVGQTKLNYQSLDDESQKALSNIVAGNNTAEFRSKAYSHLREWEQRSILFEANKATMIPQGFRDAFEIAFAGKGSILPLCDYTITNDSETFPYPFVDDSANTGRRIDETAAHSQTGADPEIVTPVLGSIGFDSDYARISKTLLERSPFNLAAMLGTVLGERLIRAMDNEIIVGPGTAGRFRGLVARAATGKSIPFAGTAAIAVLQDLVFSVIDEYRRNGTLVFHDTFLAAIVKLTDSTQQFLLGTGNQRVQIGKDISVPFRVCNFFPSLTGIGAGARPAYFGDFSRVKVRITRDVPLERFNEIFASLNQTGYLARRYGDSDLVRSSNNDTCPVKAVLTT